MTAMGKVGWSDPAKAGPMLAKIPLGRFAEVEDVVNCILFLLSEKAAMVNGVTLPIDGGFLATWSLILIVMAVFFVGFKMLIIKLGLKEIIDYCFWVCQLT